MEKRLIVILIIAMMFTAGCTSLFGGGNTASSGKGISIEFLPNRPKIGQINEGEAVPVTVVLYNNGYNLANGELCVYDDKSNIFGGIEDGKDCRTFVLAGSGINTEGESINRAEQFSFPAEGEFYYYRNINNQNFDTIIYADVSYSYVVASSPLICVSGNDRDCRLEQTISGSQLGQDALRSPVTVTRVQASLAPAITTAGLSLEIYIQNVGNGNVVDDRGDGRERVDVNINLIDAELRCNPTSNGVITLDNKAKVITCSANIPLTEGTQNNPIDIELRYNYYEKKDRKFNVVNSPV